jgi:ketosteroid isomerase-like protein
MSQPNVEIVRAFLAAFSDRGLDAFAEFVDPDINWRAVEGAVDDVGEIEGLAAVRAYVAHWLDTFENLALEPEELIDAGSDHVLAVLRLRGRAKVSGIETELQ